MKKIAIIIASHQGVAPALILHPKQNYSTQAKDRKIPVPPSTRSRPLSPPILPVMKLSSSSALSASVSGPSPPASNPSTRIPPSSTSTPRANTLSPSSPDTLEEPTNSPAGLPPYLGHSPSSRPKATTTILTPFRKDSRGGRQNPSGR